MGEWQPIETAPRDGQQILLGHGNSVWLDEWCNWLGTIEAGGRWMTCPANEVPTHWMPLPPPPDTLNLIEKESGE